MYSVLAQAFAAGTGVEWLIGLSIVAPILMLIVIMVLGRDAV